MSDYGPGDTWPEHPKAWWRETLGLARSSGWRLEPSRGHIWGTIRCPQHCKIVVFSTGTNGETAARAARFKVARCQHSPTSRVARASAHLDDAEQLTDAAEVLLERRESQAQVEEMLDHANEALTAADEEDLLARIDELPVGDDDVEGALSVAQERVDSAKSQLRDLPTEVAKPHRARAMTLRARIDGLRDRASTLSTVYQPPSKRHPPERDQ